MTLRRLITIAYRVQDFQISGGPHWLDSARYSIIAETDGHNGVDAMLLMLQTLLEDRFRLRYHNEMREGPVYLLSVARSGSKLRVANCVPFDPNHMIKQSHLSPEARKSQCGGIKRTAGTLDGNGMSLVDAAGPPFQSLAGQLTLVLDRPVINRTGFSGTFDVHLTWDQAPIDAPTEFRNPSGTPLPSPQNGPSIFTAVQEQLGLKLKAANGPVDYFVIDQAARPSEN